MTNGQPQISNRKVVQVFLISLVVILIIASIAGLKYFMSGFLGAVTLYILFRHRYHRLTTEKNWNKSITSILFIGLSLSTLALPLYLLIRYIVPQASSVIDNRDRIVVKFNQVKEWMASKPVLSKIDMSADSLVIWVQKVLEYVPQLLGSVAAMLTNIVVAFFVLYFMQTNSRLLERTISLSIPFSARSKKLLWAKIELMVRSNTIGIPVMAFCQAVFAAIGYMFFDVNNALLWGLLTGAATIVPVVGTLLIWVPVCLVLVASGQPVNAFWLALYCFIVVGGVDNVLRFTFLKSLGNVPPLITVFGVILGLNLFGLLGLIFGPLLLSLIGVLMEVYRNEYGRRQELSQILLKRNEKRQNFP